MSKYLKVEVSKTLSSDLCLIVPDNAALGGKSFYSFFQVLDPEQIQSAVKETIDSYEWEEIEGIEIQGWKEIPKEEAEQYLVYDVAQKKVARKGD